MKKFKKVYIEITNVCNLNCAFCPKTKREPRMMDVERFSHVAKAVRPYTDQIYFHIMGEPLLHPELAAFLDIAHENDLKVNITTNGTLLNKAAQVLLSSPALRKVGVSIHCIEENEKAFDEDEYILNVAGFVDAASKAGIICELRLWNLKGDKQNAENKQNLATLKHFERLLGLKENLAEEALNKRKMKLRENIYFEAAEEFEWPDISLEHFDGNVFCHGLRDQFGVLSDGTVVPCCLDHDGDIPLGNIFAQPLDEILNSERTKKIYDGFSKRRAAEELCKRCGYARRFSLKI